MKKVTLMLFVGIFLVSSAISAQNNTDTTRNYRGPRFENRMTPEKRAEIMADQLKLTDAQKAQVAALFEKNEKERVAQIEEQRAKRESLRKEREAQRAEMQQLREKEVSENLNELEKIIGKEKMNQWKENRSDFQRKYREDNRRGPRFSGRRR